VVGVEVNGKKLNDGLVRDDSNAKGRLSIIEAEIYARPDTKRLYYKRNKSIVLGCYQN